MENLTSKNIGIRHGLVCFLLVFTLVGFGVNSVNGQEAVSCELKAFKVEKSNPDSEQEKLVPAQAAKPGQVIEYRAKYTNNLKKKITSLKPTIPIPTGMTWIPGRKEKVSEASLDGKNFQKFPIKESRTLESGKVEQVAVDPSRYRALRWYVQELPAGGDILISTRVMID